MRENSTTSKKYILALGLVLCACLLTTVSFAQGHSAQEIIKLSDDLMRGDTSQGRYKMTVTTPNWTRTLELDAFNEGRNKTFIHILSPVKEAGITTLRIENNMWNYLPKVERTVKIPPSMMLQPWMGSDFTNDDLVKESSIVYDYNHKIIGEETTNSDLVYKIELIPKPDAAVTWGKLLFWIRKSDLVPVREEFYNERGKLIKTLEYSDVKQMSDRSIPTIWKMSSAVKKGHVTIIEVVDVVYDQPVEKSVFTRTNRKGPR
jgi:outer membrane lipoprotein-sorting protein